MTFDPLAITLARGAHPNSDDVCFTEAVSLFAGEKKTDTPACACPVLTQFGITINDRWQPEERQLLRPLIPLLVGTRSTVEIERKRAFLLVDRVIRSILPMSLDITRHGELASQLRALDPIVDRDSALRVREVAAAVSAAAAHDVATAYAYAAAAYAAAAAAAYAASRAAAAAAAHADVASRAAAAAAYAAAADAAAAYADAAYAASRAAAAYDAHADAAASRAAAAAARRPIIEATIEAFREAIAITEES